MNLRECDTWWLCVIWFCCVVVGWTIKLGAGTNKSHKIRYKIRLVPRSFLCDNWIWIPSCTEIAQCPGVITTCSLPCVRQIRPFDGSNCRGHCVASVKWMGALKLPRPPVLPCPMSSRQWTIKTTDRRVIFTQLLSESLGSRTLRLNHSSLLFHQILVPDQ